VRNVSVVLDRLARRITLGDLAVEECSERRDGAALSIDIRRGLALVGESRDSMSSLSKRTVLILEAIANYVFPSRVARNEYIQNDANKASNRRETKKWIDAGKEGGNPAS
jgi:hypothetical protein